MLRVPSSERKEEKKSANPEPRCDEETPSEKSDLDAAKIKAAVRETYGKVVRGKGAGSFSTCCSSGQKSCCSGSSLARSSEYAKELGYTEEDTREVSGANLGLGCGNPIAIASLRPGEVVLDLGSGAGFDCFLAAKKVGISGKVIGIDMTPDMVEKARAIALRRGHSNVEFRLAEIEHLPLPDNTVDVVISNCVVNLSPDKLQVFREAARVLKPGGRLAISDVIATRELPRHIKKDLALYTGCMAGATPVAKLTEIMRSCGFGEVRIQVKEESRSYIGHWAPGNHAEDYVASASIFAYKPTSTPSRP